VQLAKEREDKQLAAVNAINSDENIQALKDHFDARVLPGTIELFNTREENEMKNALGNIMQQAQKMQEDLKKHRKSWL